MDRDYKPILIEYIPASCLNISSRGMSLEWPLWWKCEGCPYCGDKFASDFCSAGRCPFDDTGQFLIAATLLRIYLEDKKTERYAKVVWVSEKKNCCRIGVCFSF